MAQQDIVDLLRQINDNILALKKLKELEMREVITREIERVASTSIRKKMWVLSDGTKSTEEISNAVSVSKRAVQYFVQECLNSGLLGIEKRGYPVRRIEWVPPEWAESMFLREVEEKNMHEAEQNE